MLFGSFIPFQLILLPMAQTLGWLGLAGSTAGLVLVHVVYGLPFTTLFFRNYYEAFPNELIRAAMIDGAGFFRIFWRILLPSSGPIIVVTVIFQFTNIWNDFLFGLVVIPSNALQPVTVALNNLSGTTSVDWNVVMAGALIAAVPTLLAYIFFGIRPARYASRPAMTACFIAVAMAIGSCAPAIAVFIRTASAPSSIASAASEAVPTPAWTITGTVENSRLMRMLFTFWMPSPEPIGAPSGMTAAAPASSSLRQAIGSSLV